jgi:hypothetical protein
MAGHRVSYFASFRNMLALTNQTLLTDTFPPTDPHNTGARILRLGVAISAFSLLEGFLEETFSELMKKIAGSKMGLPHFPPSLRYLLTVDAVSGLSTRLNFLARPDRQAFADKHIPLVAGYSNTPPTYTALGFSPRGSNVAHDDISSIFKAFEVDDPWTKLSRIATEIGATRVDLLQDYKNLSKTRHNSAHDPSSNVPTTDLQNHVEVAIVIAIAADILATAVGSVFVKAGKASLLKAALNALSHTYRFIDEQTDGKWLERAPSGHAIKSYANESAARIGTAARATPAFIVCRNIRKAPIELC